MPLFYRCRLALSSLVLLATACGHDRTTAPLRASALERVSDAELAATVGTTSTLRVRAVATDGQGVPGVVVSWTAEGGSLTSASTTDAAGYAENVWSLPTVTGDYHAHASIAGAPPVDVTAHASAAAVDTVQIQSERLFTLQQSGARQLVARAADRYGNVIATPAIVWTSSSGTVAGVSATGYVLAAGQGGAAIVATIGNRADTVYVKVDETAWIGVALGRYHTCGLSLDNRIFCWGQGAYGELGDGVSSARPYPAPVASTEHFTAISGAGYHMCALATTGAISCWGDNPMSVWNPQATDRAAVPTLVPGSVVFSSVSSGMEQNCGLTSAGDAYCWGTEAYGGLGNGVVDYSNVSTPTRVLGGPYQVLESGETAVCAVRRTGTVDCWGVGPVGHAIPSGQPSEVSLPTPVAGGGQFMDVNVGFQVGCAINAAGAPACWGANVFGQADYRQVGTDVPAPVMLPTPALAGISVGQIHTCALTRTRQVLCWGVFDWSDIATTDMTKLVTTPAMVPFPEPVIQVSASSYGWHSCAVTVAGNLYCWGNNDVGQLGDGTTTTREAPVRVVEPH